MAVAARCGARDLLKRLRALGERADQPERVALMSLNQSKWCVAGGAALLFTCATVAGAQTYQGALRGVCETSKASSPAPK